MKRKFKDGRPLGAGDKTPRRRAPSRTAIRRLTLAAQENNWPVARLVAECDGSVSLIIGSNKTDDTTNSKNPWDEATNATGEKRVT
jgi:hypothetical protein